MAELSFRLECGLKKEFPQLPEEALSGSNGVAWGSLGEAFVFIDSIVNQSNIWEPDIIESCWHCSLEKDCRIDPYLAVYSQEISRVTVHELLHLCGVTEEQVNYPLLYPFWSCPVFKNKESLP